jgi:hypothetical protein
MANLTLRSTKGSALTNNEVDNNFTGLNNDLIKAGTWNNSTGLLTLTQNDNTTLTFTVAPNVFSRVTAENSDGSDVGTVVSDSLTDTLYLREAGGIELGVNAASDIITVGHANTSSVSNLSSNNSGNTFIQDVSFTFDTYGHVTGASVATGTVNQTNFQVEDGDGTEVTINDGKEWKFVEGAGDGASIDINWTDTSPGSDADPFDLTFKVTNTDKGSSQNIFKNFEVTDTNSGFTWSSAGTIVADNNNDRLKIVDGGGVDISVDTGNDAILIQHSDTSSQASVNNSNGNIIQDITLDTYGHITGLNSLNGDNRWVNKTGDTMTGDLTFSDTGEGVVWSMNTDGAYIKFFNTGDSDTNSRLEYGTSDNDNEYHRWMVDTNERMRLTDTALTVSASLDVTGGINLGTPGGGDSVIQFHDDNSNTERSLYWDDSANGFYIEDKGGAGRAILHDGNLGYSENGKNYPVELSNGKMYVNVPWVDTNTNTNTTYSVSVPTSTTKIRLSGSDSSTDDIEIAGGSNVTVTRNDASKLTISSTNTTYSTATSSTLGLVKIGYTESGKNYPVELSSGKMYVNVPWTDTNTTYSEANSSVYGLVKTGYAENGKNYPVELSSGKMYVNVPWTDTNTNTTYSAGTNLSLSGTTFNVAASPSFTDVYVADQIFHTGDTDTYTQFHAANQWRVVTGGAERLEVNNTNVTISNTLVETSDARLKENVHALDSSLEKVCNLRGVSFNKIEKPEVKEIGFIAQEVEEIVPELVFSSEDGMKSVSYARTVALLVEAIKELKAEVEELKAINNK